MVEKWLLQVEKLMLSSVRKVIYEGMLNYKEVYHMSTYEVSNHFNLTWQMAVWFFRI